MDLAERREKIIEMLSSSSYVTVEEFVRCMGVSAVTIRSDLSSLEKEGVLIRTHGGAMIVEKKSQARFISQTMKEYEEEKKAIAKKACTLLSDGNTIILDSGSTTTRMVDSLTQSRLTVVTNNIIALDAMADKSNINVIALGGQLRRESMGTIGPIANAAVKSLNVDIYFMGGAAYNRDGISSTDLTESELKKSMLRASEKVVFLADSTKFGKKSFSTICTWDKVDTFITDKINPSFREELEKMGVEVITADE